jgi:hypothetical protein
MLFFVFESNEPMVDDLAQLKNMDDDALAAQVKPELEALEVVRHAKLKVLALRQKMAVPIAMIGVPITGLIDYMLLFGGWFGDDPAAGLTIVFLGALWYWVSEPKRQYTKSYKRKILPQIAKSLGNLKYLAKGKLIVDSLKASKIVPRYNCHEREDYFYGEYKGAKIELSEIKLEYESGSGDDKTVEVVFDGLVFLIDVPKDVYGHTVLLPNKNGFFEWFKKKDLGLERANLVSLEFEDIYDVYTNDQVEARYLVHPKMIESFTALSKGYDGGKLSAEYYNGRLLLLLPTRTNHFEPASIHIEATNVESLIEMKHELVTVLSIVDELELAVRRRHQEAV